MRAVLQRVTESSVSVDGTTVGEIGKGFLLLLGVMKGDTRKQAELLARKTAALRVFCDENGKMNRSVLDIGGSILAVSQFTLCADVHHGNRPSFTDSMEPKEAEELYDYFCGQLLECGVKEVPKGVFGADMAVRLVNDGPVTICLDTALWEKNECL